MAFFLTIPLWVWLLSSALAFGLAYYFYKREQVWDNNKNLVLLGLRTFSIFWLFIFLFSPKSEVKTSTTEQPIWLFLMDDSESVKHKTPKSVLNELSTKLKNNENWLNNNELVIQSFSNEQIIDSIFKFKAKESDLAKQLKSIQEKYQHKNIAGVVIASDGIVNRGLSPLYQDYRFPIYAIGLGDTIPEKDVLLKNIEHNKINFKGNSFPIKARIQQVGFDRKKITVSLLKGGKAVAIKNVEFRPGQGMVEVDFLWSEDKTGNYSYTIQVEKLAGEYTHLNNQQSITLEVVEGKEKILVLSPYPHPDLKAIQESLLKNNHYEVKLCIPGVFDFEEGLYDAMIAFHVPTSENPKANQIFEKLTEKQVPVCFFLGSGSNFSLFNQFSKSVQFNARGRETDKVQGMLKTSFSSFSFEAEKKDVFASMPPIVVPFGEVVLKQNPDVFMFQKVGAVATEKPLWMLGASDGMKNAVVFGEGWWRAKMHEKRETQNTDFFDMAILKTIQFISVKADKRRLKIYPSQNVYSTSENVFFVAETYNEIFEKISGQNIKIELSNSELKNKFDFEFVSSEFNPNIEIGSLPEGEYFFKATTELNGKKETANGKFKVEELHLELVDLTADHELLKSLAQKNGGFFANAAQLEKFFSQLNKVKTFSRTKTKSDVKDAIYLWQLLLLSLIGFCVEWGLRKWWGGY